MTYEEDRFRDNCGLLVGAGFVQEFDCLDNGLFMHPAEKRAVAPSALRSASREEVEAFIRDKKIILWGIDETVQKGVLRRLGRA